jgi:hypothetical protein
LTASRIANQNSHANPNANLKQSGNLDLDINNYSNKTNSYVNQPRQQHNQQQSRLQDDKNHITSRSNQHHQYHQQQQSYQQMNPYPQQSIRSNVQSSQHQRGNNNSVLGDSRSSGVHIIDNHFIPSQPVNLNKQIKNSQQQPSGSAAALTVQVSF